MQGWQGFEQVKHSLENSVLLPINQSVVMAYISVCVEKYVGFDL